MVRTAVVEIASGSQVIAPDSIIVLVLVVELFLHVGGCAAIGGQQYLQHFRAGEREFHVSGV